MPHTPTHIPNLTAFPDFDSGNFTSGSGFNPNPTGVNSLGPAVQLPEYLQGTAAGSDGVEPGAMAKLFGKDSPLITGLDTFGKLFNTYNSFQALQELTKQGRANRQAQRLNSNNNALAYNAQIDDRVRSGASQSGVASNQMDSVVRSTNRDRYISGLG